MSAPQLQISNADKLRVHVGIAKGISTSRKSYCEVQILDAQGQPVGKPQRTKVSSVNSSNPAWNEDLYFDSSSVGGFLLTVWEYHRIFPDVFLGIVTLKFNATDSTPAGTTLVDSEFTFSKRKVKDKVSGTIKVSVQFKQPSSKSSKLNRRESASSSSSDSTPAVAEKGGRRQLKVSSKWAAKDNQLAQSGFVVVEESLDDSEHESDASLKPPKRGGGSNGQKSPSSHGSRASPAPSSKPGSQSSSATSTVVPTDPKDQVALVIKMSSAEGSILRDVELDESSQNLGFALYNEAKDQESFVTLMVPDDHRTGEYMLFTNDGVIEIGAVGSVLAAMNKVLASFAETNHLTKFGPKFPEPEAPIIPKKAKGPQKKGRAGLMESFATNATVESEVFDVQEQAIEEGAALSGENQPQKRIAIFVDEFKKLHGPDSCVVVKTNKSTSLRLAFEPKAFLSALLGEIWDIDITRRIVVELELVPPLFIDSMISPKVKTFQSASTDLAPETLSDSHSFGLQWYLVKRIENFLARTWPPKQTHLLLDLVGDCREKINDCTKNCLICDKKLEFRMMKPTICDAQLCKFSYDQYGLGADVCSQIRYHPDIVDLLVSITYVAARGDARRFSPYPENVEYRSKKDGTETILNFGTAKNPNMGLIADVLDTLPPIKDLAQFQTSEALRAHLDTYHKLLYPLLRWIITSNRAHLARLKEHEKVNGTGTNLQFMFLSSPPEKERKFQAAKKKHGSFWAFHGSHFGNWHAILRTGLRNLSNTELMSAGAVYGAGIYLATESGTSAGYASSAPGWPKSMFNSSPDYADNFQCVALCEVISAGYKANPYYVVPNEDHVVTRYFFIYNSTNVHSAVNASSAKPPKTDYERELAL